MTMTICSLPLVDYQVVCLDSESEIDQELTVVMSQQRRSLEVPIRILGNMSALITEARQMTRNYLDNQGINFNEENFISMVNSAYYLMFCFDASFQNFEAALSYVQCWRENNYLDDITVERLDIQRRDNPEHGSYITAEVVLHSPKLEALRSELVNQGLVEPRTVRDTLRVFVMQYFIQ